MAARLLFVALALFAACGHGPNFQAVPIGSPCKNDGDCGTAPFLCAKKGASGTVYPNGYCSEPCSTGVNGVGCPVDSACVDGQCRRTCTDDTTCRFEEGYSCVD